MTDLVTSNSPTQTSSPTPSGWHHSYERNVDLMTGPSQTGCAACDDDTQPRFCIDPTPSFVESGTCMWCGHSLTWYGTVAGNGEVS
jgi:hypothetical protein